MTLAVAAVVVLAVEVEVAQPFRVPTSSMEPTLRCARPGVGCTASLNDRVIVAKIVYRFRGPRRGEIAVFHAPALAKTRCSEGGTYLKRVIGLPGEQVTERNGFFYVDGKKLSEPYLGVLDRDSVTASWPRLGKDRYFVMGDNRGNSKDSRVFGPIPKGLIVGRAFIRVWPISSISLL